MKKTIFSKKTPRIGWKESFEAMAKAGDDTFLDAATLPEEAEDREWD